QEELAFKAGLNPAYVSHLERGIYSPTLYVFWKLAKALGMSVSDLLKGI
ncbi:transcriptional regulator, partial [Candidatus Woesebacteria bacterium RIFCSPHIGHO2_02_FULL_38_9]